MSAIALRRFEPADAPWVVDQHERLYAQEEGYDSTFRALVTDILDGFIADHDPTRETGWIAEQNGTPVGCIFCVSAGPTTAKLRMFLALPEVRGQGLGKRLLTECMNFARSAGYTDMTLWTHESHKAACALYVAHGWTLQHSTPGHEFGVDVVDQVWTTRL